LVLLFKANHTMDEDEEISPTQEIDFCTLGMLIIGEKPYFTV